jgi:hypothetical protein
MENNDWNLLYEEAFDQDQQVNQVYVLEEDDHVLQYYISLPSKYRRLSLDTKENYQVVITNCCCNSKFWYSMFHGNCC